MRLDITGIAKINNAKVELSGITVIAGENNTGKSTIGKILFAMNDFLYGFDQYVESDIKNAIRNEIESLGDFLDVISKEHFKLNRQFRRKTARASSLQNEFVDKIYILFTNHNKNKLDVNLEQYAKKHIDMYEVDFNDCRYEIEIRISEISDTLKELFLLDEHEIGIGSVTESFSSVFKGQINSLNLEKRDSEVILTDDYGKKSTVRIKDNECYYVDCNTPMNGPAIFIENPRAIEELNSGIMRYYYMRKEESLAKSTLEMRREQLRQVLRPNYDSFIYNKRYRSYEKATSDARMTLAQKKLKLVNELLQKAVSGEYKNENGMLLYQEVGMTEPVKLENLSTGLKAMVLLEQIIRMGILQEKAILILDEPEINLHPEWQLLYAEIIVLLQEVYNLNIVITTHSPYFLKAIEMFVEREDRKEKCKFYAAEIIDNIVELSDMSDRINILFRMLAEPLRDLKKMEY